MPAQRRHGADAAIVADYVAAAAGVPG